MKESEFLTFLAVTYGGISEPQDCAVEFIGIAKRIVRCTKIDKTQKPPTLESWLITYYVKNVGEVTEETFISPSISNPIAVDGVKTAYADAYGQNR
jgi:hypothetical protein